MWIKRNTLERKIADVMGYEYCVLFESCRAAIYAAYWISRGSGKTIPSNVCPELSKVLRCAEISPISPDTGLAPGVPVQLYGYRKILKTSEYEIDPLMTGFLGRPFAKECFISFGQSKTLNIGVGGAFLSNEKPWFKGYFPSGLRGALDYELSWLNTKIDRRRQRLALWDRHLGDSCIRIPMEQVIPWRVIRRIPQHRDVVVAALRANGFDAGTNYPPLPGVTDPGAIQWGKEVINLWVSEDYDEPRIRAACEIIKRTIG